MLVSQHTTKSFHVVIMKILWCHEPFQGGPRDFGIDFKTRKLIKIQLKETADLNLREDLKFNGAAIQFSWLLEL